MLLKDKIYVFELREQFLQKIVDEWEVKWQEDFDEFVSFDALKSKNAFLESLLADIEENLHQQRNGQAKKYLFSKDFLRRFIFEYGAREVRIQTHSRTAIALYLGYKNWEDFVEQNKEIDNQTVNINYVNVDESLLPALSKTQLISLNNEPYAVFQEVKPRSAKNLFRLLYSILTIILIGVGGYFLFNWWITRPFSADELKNVQFKIIKTVGQYPQAVRIMYDLGKIDRVQNVEVELGVGKIVSINNIIGYITKSNKLKDTIAQTYFYPGIYQLKLFVNNRAVKELKHIVYSHPNKWTAWGNGLAYEKSWTTNISTVKNYIQDGVFHFDPKELRNDIKSENDYSNAIHALTQDFGVRMDSMTFEARMKNPESEGGEGCYDMHITTGDKNFNFVNAGFTRFGCADYAKLTVGKTIFRRITDHPGKNYDLHEFGVNQNEWNNFKIKILGDIIEVFINDKSVFKNTYERNKDFSDLIDTRFTFNGAGSIDWVKISNSYTGKIVYQTDFNEEEKTQ
ncbi:hypothetical protein [Emticicia sp. C21]|uniref:hypothetical protein n=1 Tax=Emticicia sp. C21 TaxID=2302915 RepID=UPI000E353EBE|nr:hypothetical protein [Emticicia sp. C21]RFS17590.1 hypothetical protein D0T08_07420 [Emticicia sp. C21]